MKALEQALTGLRVLDLTRLVPGPYLTLILADLGADVVKVEAPGVGDYLRLIPPFCGSMSARFTAINRGKRSLVLDLKKPAPRDAFLRLVEGADVVVESFRPGVIDRLGIGWDTLASRNPGIILCSLSGYGQTGPYRDRVGHDLNYAGIAGAVAMGGIAGGEPLVPGVQLGDFAGALWAATGIAAALIQRYRTGAGTWLDIALNEGVMALLSAEFGNLAADSPSGAPADARIARPTRGTQTLNGGLACYRLYRTGDDKYLAVAALEPKFWMALCRGVGRDGNPGEVAGPPAQQRALTAELAEIFAGDTRDRWMERLEPYECCVEPVLELDEVPDHPQVRSRGVFFDPARFHVRTPLGHPQTGRPAPSLGQHSREVLAEYGFTAADIDAVVTPR